MLTEDKRIKTRSELKRILKIELTQYGRGGG